MPDCHLCRDPITTGETRQAVTTASGQAVTVHQTCHIPPSPATRFETGRIGDEVTLTANDTEVVGTIAGTGMIHTPARGRYLFIEAAQFDDLPTDRVMIVHHYENGSFQDVHAYVDTDPFEAGGWEDIGEVDKFGITADE